MMRRNDQKREYDIGFGEEDFMKIGWLQIIMAVIYMGILIGLVFMSRKVKSSDDFWIGEDSEGRQFFLRGCLCQHGRNHRGPAHVLSITALDMLRCLRL